MRTQISLNLQPFSVPDCIHDAAPPARRQDDYHEPQLKGRAFRLSELDENTLLRMCEDFKREVFRRAGKIEFLNQPVERSE